MSPSSYEPRAIFEGGAVRYPDAASLRSDLEPFLRHGIVPVVGEHLPAPMEELDFAIELPGGARVMAHGQVISLRDASALLRVAPWSEADWAALEAASRDVAPPAKLAPSERPTPPGVPAPPPKAKRESFRLTTRSTANVSSTSLRAIPPPPAPPQAPAPASVAPSEGRRIEMPFSSRVTSHDLDTARPPDTVTSPARQAPAPSTKTGLAAVEDDLRALYERRSRGNLFDALGLHFTDAPSRIRDAYRAIVAEYRSGSPAHRRAAAQADMLLKLANQAWDVLSDKGSRRRYRREILGVDVDSAAQLLASKSRLAMSRGDLAAARELLEAAADLHPDPEYLEDLRNLLSGNLPPPETEDTVELVRPPNRRFPRS